MIINKTTSDATLVASLRLFTANNKTISGVQEFDTSTLSASLTAGGSVTAADFNFYIDDPTQGDVIVPLLEAEPDGEDLVYRIKVKTSSQPKKAMDDSDTAPEEQLVKLGRGTVHLVKCTNCDTLFLIFEVGGKLYSGAMANPADKWMTATELDPDNLTCDNCSEKVVVGS